MFDAVKSDAGLTDNVWNKIAQRKLETHHKKPLTIEQFKNILPFAEEEMKTLLLLAFYTGLRLGDCCNLKRDNIDFKNRTISLISSKTYHLFVLKFTIHYMKHFEIHGILLKNTSYLI